MALLACGMPLEEESDPRADVEGEPGFGVQLAQLTNGSERVCADKTVKGIDVSKWQAEINWKAVAADGIKFAFIRVSDGLEYDDPYFVPNWKAAKKHGILRGAYQFFRPGQDPIAQANYLLGEMGPLEPGDLPPVLDLEVTDGKSKSLIAKKVRRWASHVEDKLGVKPIVYTSPSFWSGKVGTPDQFADLPLWVAHWTDQCPLVPQPWQRWDFWQYSSHGSVKGINGRVDRNRFNGTLEQLRQYAGVTPEPEPEPEPTCGDQICQAGEDLQSCAVDCAPAPGPVADTAPQQPLAGDEGGGCAAAGAVGATDTLALLLMVFVLAVAAPRTHRRRSQRRAGRRPPHW